MADSKKTKRLSKEAEEIHEHKKAAEIIKGYEEIIITKKRDYKRRISSRNGFIKDRHTSKI